MYVRLAFAIATSIDPDILIVDEALSVGDQRFQKKSIERMMQFRKLGKTIIFCSHSMYLVSELCDRALWIHNGEIVENGETERIIQSYEKWCLSKDQGQTREQDSGAPVLVENVEIQDQTRAPLKSAKRHDGLIVAIRIYAREPLQVHIGVGFQKISGESIFGVTTKGDKTSSLLVDGRETIEVHFPDIQLISGAYQAFGVVMDEHALHVYDLKLSSAFDIEKTSAAYGVVFMEHTWKTNQLLS
jgi:ABC-type glutathione transport system ATPase component